MVARKARGAGRQRRYEAQLSVAHVSARSLAFGGSLRIAGQLRACSLGAVNKISRDSPYDQPRATDTYACRRSERPFRRDAIDHSVEGGTSPARAGNCHINERSPPSFLFPRCGAGHRNALAFIDPEPPPTDPQSIHDGFS